MGIISCVIRPKKQTSPKQFQYGNIRSRRLKKTVYAKNTNGHPASIMFKETNQQYSSTFKCFRSKKIRRVYAMAPNTSKNGFCNSAKYVEGR